ncbi:xanthine dehydrogenase accessory protein XdhC [Endozoicomonas sp. SM1973]|uniref:Xanthine dehydrogenase accessory protein XdhC n=1 Tax=Spartinivicinus marinus TaxID=2994442 RepID=A0A853I6A8_9GAMM|nr:xanthine dehydrogenase accessory protein XdhC [Spartinivicinus marinus]MCX4029523.1 xanthine dehydrogenase accessory protein XdhC [Spartinivicinus marinus]NYZ65097.1 xanthine dehydrogenase accessory protein XdhC [Spartinivicinus marinus]
MSMNWVEAVNQLNTSGDAFVLVTLLATRGSTPRDSGTKMVVSVNTTYDTIGGGHLEYQIIATAQKMLAEQQPQQHLAYFPLGPSLGQCCGGSTIVLFEQFSARQVSIMLFGAGHVGKALISILGELPCQVSWVDSRPDQFPLATPNNVKTITSKYPADEVHLMPANSYFLVMTHSHQLDYDICETILKRNHFSYLGLIGSTSKWRRFKQRLTHKKFDDNIISRIQCPVGLNEVPGKRPMEVAVSIAGEIINHYQQHQSNNDKQQEKQQGIQWQQLKSLVTEVTAKG